MNPPITPPERQGEKYAILTVYHTKGDGTVLEDRTERIRVQ